LILTSVNDDTKEHPDLRGKIRSRIGSSYAHSKVKKMESRGRRQGGEEGRRQGGKEGRRGGGEEGRRRGGEEARRGGAERYGEGWRDVQGNVQIFTEYRLSLHTSKLVVI
jgi:flagellar biosynthesis/type III secretory pathway protein FliH